MRRHYSLLAVLLLTALLGGCVERRFIVDSEPRGAAVMVNGKPLPGATPVDGTYLYHGYYDITLIKDGYETQTVRERLKPHWYEIPPLDFITENLVPWRIKDVRCLGPYQLQPVQPVRQDELIQRSLEMQAQTHALAGQQPPGAAPCAPVPPPSAAAPPPLPTLGPPR